MSGAIPLLPLYACMVWTGKTPLLLDFIACKNVTFPFTPQSIPVTYEHGCTVPQVQFKSPYLYFLITREHWVF
jgi:hypothetical protein